MSSQSNPLSNRIGGPGSPGPNSGRRDGDRVRTSLQADGAATVIGSSVAELVAMCDDLALDPRKVFVHGQVRLRP